MAEGAVEVLQRLQREEGHHQLPALLQHDRERVPAVRRRATRPSTLRSSSRELIRQGRVKFDGTLAKSIVYHDSCYLGRYNDVYDGAARDPQSHPRRDPQEASRSRNQGMCCGAGGGRMWIEEHPDQRVNSLRVDAAARDQARHHRVGLPLLHDDALRRREGQRSRRRESREPRRARARRRRDHRLVSRELASGGLQTSGLAWGFLSRLHHPGVPWRVR